jgi:hypothetical protein
MVGVSTEPKSGLETSRATLVSAEGTQATPLPSLGSVGLEDRGRLGTGLQLGPVSMAAVTHGHLK